MAADWGCDVRPGQQFCPRFWGVEKSFRVDGEQGKQSQFLHRTGQATPLIKGKGLAAGSSSMKSSSCSPLSLGECIQ